MRAATATRATVEPACQSIELVGARAALGPHAASQESLCVEDGRFVSSKPRDAVRLDADGLLLLPGLINAHDHLDFALFPRLGSEQAPFVDARAWAQAIYHPNRSPIREHLEVPSAVRLQWGGLRNLLSGATTVCHHNPWNAAFESNFPVRVVRRMGWAHSLDFEPDPRERFHQTPTNYPFVIHAGEGADEASRAELSRLDELDMLSNRTVIVHGVAFGSAEFARLTAAGAALICCPSTNLFSLGRTANVAKAGSPVRLALGTDSPLTAAGDLLDEIRLAPAALGLPAERVYEMVTREAADVLRLGAGQGTLAPGAPADWIAIADRGLSPAEALGDPAGVALEAVWIGGKLQLAADPDRWGFIGLERLEYGGRGFHVATAVSKLMGPAQAALGAEIRLGGKPVRANLH